MIGAHTALALIDLGHDAVVTTHRRTAAPRSRRSSPAGSPWNPLDVTDRDAFLALRTRHDISDIVHLADTVPDDDPVRFFRTDTAGSTPWTPPAPGASAGSPSPAASACTLAGPRPHGTRSSHCAPPSCRT